MKKPLVKNFIEQLKHFADGGHVFANGKSLREGTQEDAVKGFTTGLEQGHTHGHFEIPTGVGKTATFIALIDSYLKAAEASGSDKRVLVVVPSVDLVTQTAKAFAKFMPDVAKTIETDDDEGKEIDWENSDIGAQYSKRKDATKKPKILITTYQSLVKDTDHTTYPPKDYGFVVYDEGHYITAAQFSKSIEKFSDSVQLAVTATREYSEEKNVQQYLPHEYYRLPIREAIERNDLCGVQPILVQTDFTIDQRKFDSFIQQNNGRPLTEKQKQDLFNQKTRNQAILETYLLGKDHETGERYFGQTGLIFAAGIAHCKDIKNQLTESIKQPKYKPLKEWLDKEGVALAAEIHSRTKGEELTIGGKKRFYSKDEIKELHREGKILLLLSDQELKQGTDFPADSIIMDVVDRYSWVDTKQRYGRGYRLDPDNADKVCKVFNFMDKNTKEIYGDSPESLPIYCAETLEGVQFKKQPAKTAFKRFKEPPPELDAALSKSGYELITDIERIKKVSSEYKKIRDAAILPEKTPDHFTLSRELPKALMMAPENPKYHEWFLSIEAEIQGGGTPIIGGNPVIKMQSGSKTPLCVHKDAVPVIAALFGIELQQHLPKKTDDHLTLKSELPRVLGTSHQNKNYLDWVESVEASIKQGATPKISGHPVIKMKSGGETPLCLHKDAVPMLAKKLGLELKDGLPEKTEDYLTLGTELPRALNTSIKGPKYSMWRESIEKEIQRGGTPKISGHPIIKMKSGGGTPLCLHKDAIPVLAKKLGFTLTDGLPEKTEDYLALGSELPTALNTGLQSPKYSMWRESIEKEIERGGAPKIGGHSVIKMKSGHRTALCLHKDAVLVLAKKLGLELKDGLPKKTEEHLTLSTELPAALNTGLQNQKYSAWRASIEKEIQRGGTPKIAGHPIIKMKSGGGTPLCLHKDAIPVLAKKLGFTLTDGLPEKKEGYLTLSSELPKALGTSQLNPDYIKWRNTVESLVEDKKTVKIGGFEVIRMRSYAQTPLCLHKDAVPTIAALIGLTKTQKTVDHLTLARELPKALRIAPENPRYQKWRASIEEEIQSGGAPKVAGHPVIKMQAGSKTPLCVHKDAIPFVKEAIEEMTSEVGSGTANGSHTSKASRGTISPTAIAAQKETRTGWSRSKTE